MSLNKRTFICIFFLLVFFEFTVAGEIPAIRLNEARNIANKAIAKKDFESALEAYKELSTQYAEDISVANDMAVILAGMGRLNDARAVLERAIINNDTSGPAFINLREILARQASISYTKALKRKPPPMVLALRSPGLDATQKVNKLAKNLNENKPLTDGNDISIKSLPDLGSEIPIIILENQEEVIKKVIISWAEAWSSKNFENYIGFYSKEFNNKKFKSINSWSRYRKPRITKRGSIKVRITKQRVSFVNERLAEVKFTQKYRSANLRLTTTKIMRLKKDKIGWKIIYEGT